MSLLTKAGLRHAVLALGAFVAVSLTLAAPALAEHGRRYDHRGGGRYWHPPFPRVVVGFPLPPVVVVAGPRGRDYGYGYDRRERAYDRGYEDGYDDGYDDRDREEWRRERYRHRYHRNCDHGYY